MVKVDTAIRISSRMLESFFSIVEMAYFVRPARLSHGRWNTQ